MSAFLQRCARSSVMNLKITENRRDKLSAIGLARQVNEVGQLATPPPIIHCAFCFRLPFVICGDSRPCSSRFIWANSPS